MKKAVYISFIAILVLFFNISIANAQDQISILLNGKALSFSDVQPTIINDRTMVPLRGIFEALGASVSYEQNTKTITATKADKIIVLTVDSMNSYVNGTHITLSTPATVVNGRTLVPVRFISESLDIYVGWDNATRTVILKTDNKEPTSPIYEVIKAGLENADIRIDLSKYINNGETPQQILDTLFKVVEDNPEIFYVSKSTQRYWSDGILEVKYSYEKDEILSNNELFKAMANKIVKEVTNINMSDFEKEKALNDYLVSHAKYDKENLENNSLTDESFTAYGILIKGTGVCEGYAKAMKVLLKLAGIESRLVSGFAENDGKTEGHMWNIVKIEGEYYHLDVTWNDPDKKEQKSYTYFNTNDEMIAKTHQWEKKDYPSCTSTANNYFYKNNLVFSNNNDIKDFLRNEMKNKKVEFSLLINNYNKDKTNVSDLIKEINREAGMDYYARVWWEGINEKMGIINICDIEYAKR